MDCHFIKRVTRISMQAWNIPFYNTTISDLLEDLPRKNVTCVTCYFPVFVWRKIFHIRQPTGINYAVSYWRKILHINTTDWKKLRR